MDSCEIKYEGLIKSDQCSVLWWRGDFLQTKINGRIWMLTRKDSAELLSSLNLKREDIPKYEDVVKTYEDKIKYNVRN